MIWKQQSLVFIFLFLISTIFFAACSDSLTDTLPDLATFQENPSDQFLVDLDIVDRTSAFVGSNNATPHDGAHVHYDNTDLYPSGSAVTTYPAIYAVADGVITDVNSYKAVGSNYKYSLILAFASDEGNTVDLEYSIEPMINPGDESTYTSFILVSESQAVVKGDIIAYMYVPENGDGTHIHFNLRNQGNKQAPAIFSVAIHDAFTSKLSEAGSCIGVDLTAEENPAGTGATDCL